MRTRSGLRGQRCQSAQSSASSGGMGSIFPEGACAVGRQTWALTSEVRFRATPYHVTSSEFLNLVESWFPQLQSRGVVVRTRVMAYPAGLHSDSAVLFHS